MSVKCLIYCTKAKPNLYRPFEYDCFEQDETSGFYLSDNPMLKEDILLNGKIVASFDCEKVEKIVATKWSVCCGCVYYQFETKDLLRKSCLEYIDLCDYLENKDGYAIHISNLEIFDKPKELSEYSKRLPNGDFQQLGKAPQNMMNVCKIKYLIEDYVLISIKPEWVAKILNGEKTIEVRKSVVNALKGLV